MKNSRHTFRRTLDAFKQKSYQEGAILSFLTDGYEFSDILPKAYSQLNFILGSDKLLADNLLEVITVGQTDAEYTNGIYCSDKKGNGTVITTITLKDGLTTSGN